MALLKWVDPEDAVEGGTERRKGSRLPIAPKAEALVGDNLEVNVNGVWYSAELSVGNDGITGVQYEGCNGDPDAEKNKVLHLDWDAEKIKSLHPLRDHIRIRSQALQHDACRFVRVGNLVWATESPKENCAYYDAFVYMIRTNDHPYGPSGEICNCKFTVEWRHGPHMGGKSTLRCGNIAKLHSTKDVETHPLIVDIVRRAYQDDVVSLRGSEYSDPDEVEWTPDMARRQGGRKRRKPKPTNVPPVKVARLKRLARAKITKVDDHFARIPSDTRLRDIPSRFLTKEENMCSGSTSGKMRGHLPFADGMALLLTPHPLDGAGFTKRKRTRWTKGPLHSQLGSS